LVAAALIHMLFWFILNLYIYFSLLYYTDGSTFFSLNVIARLIAGSGMSMLTVSGVTILFKATSYRAGTILVS